MSPGVSGGLQIGGEFSRKRETIALFGKESDYNDDFLRIPTRHYRIEPCFSGLSFDCCQACYLRLAFASRDWGQFSGRCLGKRQRNLLLNRRASLLLAILTMGTVHRLMFARFRVAWKCSRLILQANLLRFCSKINSSSCKFNCNRSAWWSRRGR